MSDDDIDDAASKKPKYPSLSQIRCPECTAFYASAYNVRRHLRVIHGKNSEELDKFYGVWERIRKKGKISKADAASKISFPCRSKIKCPAAPVSPACLTTFASVSNLRRHLSRQHGMNSEDMDKFYSKGKRVCKSERKCPYCELTLANSSNFQRHIEAQHISPKVEIQCVYCGKGFRGPRKLSSHQRSEHAEVHNKLLWCGYCSKQFKRAEELRLHVRSHGVSSQSTASSVENSK